MSTVAVVGTGAVGGFMAAHLAAAGRHQVTCCVRTPVDGLEVRRADGAVVRATPAVVTDPTRVGAVDHVLLAVKAHQTAGAAAWLERLVGPGTVVSVLQNGVEHDARVRPLVGEAVVVPTAVYCGVERTGPGRIEHRSNGFLVAADDAGGRALAELFDGVDGAAVRLTDDLATALWQKLCGNVAANGITALAQRRMDVFGDPAVRALAQALVAEAAAVGRAEGAAIDEGFAEVVATALAAMPPDGGTSMLYDRTAGRPTEHDAIYGDVLRAAARHGIDVPRTATVHALLGALAPLGDGGATGPPGPT